MRARSSIATVGRAIAPLLITLGAAAGCGDDSTAPQGGSRVAGRVDGTGGFQSASGGLGTTAVEGAVVVLARVTVEGGLEIISEAPDSTGADGTFVLATEVEGRGEFIVVATQGGNSWRALVSSELRHGTTVACPPLNSETTAEADLFLLLADDADGAIRADLAAGINGRLGVEASAQSTIRAALADGFAFGNSVTTRALVAGGATSTQLDAVARARLAALAALEAALLDARTGGDVATAVDAHLEADVEAVLDAGIAAETQAVARIAAGLGVVEAAGLVQADARLELERRVAEIRVRAAADATHELFADLGAGPSTFQALAGAQAQALASIEAASSRAGVETAVEAWGEAALYQLDLAFGADASLVAAAQAAVTDLGGPVFDLELSLVTATTAEAWVDAFEDFQAEVRAVVATTLSAKSEPERDAVSRCLTLVNIPA